MAEKLKTFVDTTWTLSDVDTSTNKLTMFTNDDNTQAVVKDVQVNMSKKITGTINTGNCVVSDEIVTLSGSAIVDKNEGMSIEIPVPFGITITRSAYNMDTTNLHYATSTTNCTTVENGITLVKVPQTTTITGTNLSESEIVSTYSSVLNIDTFPGIAVSTELKKTSKNIATMSQPAFVYRHSDTRMYYFSYDNNSTTRLLYSTNEGASWASLDTSSYAYRCVDQNGRISWVSGTVYGFVNPGAIAVGGTVQLSGRAGITSTSSYTHASECNGWHFWCPSNGYTTSLYGYNKDKNIAVNITLNSAMALSSSGGLCVSYNATEGKYFLMSWDSSSRYLHIINTDIDALVADGTGTGTSLTTSLGINHYTAYDTVTSWLPGTNDIIFRATGTNKPMRTTIYGTTPFFTTPKLVHDEAIIGGVCPSPVKTLSGEEQVIDVYADHLDTEATIQVRATGVEITE